MATNEYYVNRIQSGDNVNENMTSLYNQNMGFLRTIVKPYTVYALEDDLLQEAYFGLYTAALKYDQSKDASFLVYAEYWIRQACMRYLENYSNNIRIPTSRRQQVYSYRRILERAQVQERELTDAEICELMEVSPATLEAIKAADGLLNIRSYDRRVANDWKITIVDMIASPGEFTEEILNRVECSQLRRTLLYCISQLPERESYVIQHYFFENESQALIASDLGITVSNVSNTKKRGLQHLKERYSDQLLPFYENVIAIKAPEPSPAAEVGSWLWWRDPEIMAIYLTDKPKWRDIMDAKLTEQLQREREAKGA